jgi:serine/threonine protein kinase
MGAERLLREIRTTATLNHPHIVPLRDSGEADGIVSRRRSHTELTPVRCGVVTALSLLTGCEVVHDRPVDAVALVELWCVWSP